MDNKKLQRLVVDALEDVKGQNIEVFNTTGLSDLFDRVVLASGTSNRHTRSLASSVAEKVKAAGGKVISIEGGETGDWVLVDLGDIIVHIMQPAVRAYYTLEELWGGKPVNVKLGAAPKGARATGRSAATAGPDDDEQARPRKSAKATRAQAVSAPAASAAKAAKSAKSAKAAKTAGGTRARKTAEAAPARRSVARKATGALSAGAATGTRTTRARKKPSAS